MKVTKLPENIKIHPHALRDIKEIFVVDDKIAGKIIQRISALAINPKPFNDECTSKIIQGLKKYKMEIRRLRCMDVADYRVFYAVRKSGMICVYAVVYAKGAKHDETYSDDSRHYMRIKLLYTYWRDC